MGVAGLISFYGGAIEVDLATFSMGRVGALDVSVLLHRFAAVHALEVIANVFDRVISDIISLLDHFTAMGCTVVVVFDHSERRNMAKEPIRLKRAAVVAANTAKLEALPDS